MCVFPLCVERKVSVRLVAQRCGRVFGGLLQQDVLGSCVHSVCMCLRVSIECRLCVSRNLMAGETHARDDEEVNDCDTYHV